MYKPEKREKVFDIWERSFNFGVRIVKLTINLPKVTAGFVIGNQIIRSGTSIGANIEEAQNAGSKKEFIRAITISLKEARETEYWLRLISETGLIRKERLEKIINEVQELIRILITIIKKSKLNISI